MASSTAAARRPDSLEGDIADLYSIVEVQKQHAVPAAVAADALRLINPDLSAEEIQSLVRNHDGLGAGTLRELEFTTVVRHAIRDADLAEASQLLRDLVFRMRVAFRRRYLMYEASPNIAPDFLLDNVTTANHYRIVFDLISGGADWITRPQLRELLMRVAPDPHLRSAVGSAVKAAMGPADRPNSVGFEEFAMVLHPLTQHIPLSTLADRATAASRAPSSAGGAATSERSGSARKGAWLEDLKERQLYGGGAGAGGRSVSGADPEASLGGRRPSATDSLPPPSMVSAIRAEMPAYRLASEAAAGRIEEALQTSVGRGGRSVGGMGIGSGHAAGRRYSVDFGASMSPQRGASVAADSVFLPSSPASAPPAGGGGGSSSDEVVTALREELARSRLEVAALRREVDKAALEKAATVDHSAAMRHSLLSSNVVDAGKAAERALLDDPFYRINQLEKELKDAKVRIGMAQDSHDLYNLLLRSGSTQPLARYYTDEKALLAKHEYLRKISDIVDPQSPQFTLLSQSELLVCSYQALYRREADRARQSPFAGMGADGSLSYGGAKYSSSVSRQRSPSASAARARGRSPSIGRAGSAARPMTVVAAPLKWSEIDQPVSHEHWKTRTLGDPTLTEEERNLLRQRLAAQMRSAARARSPHLKVKHVNPNMRYSTRASSVGSASASASVGRARSSSGGASRVGAAVSDMRQHREVASALTSQEAMQRLQALTQIASKQRFL